MVKKVLYLGLDPSHYKTKGSLTHYPIIHIVPRQLHDPVIERVLRKFSQYTHLVITSKNSVKILIDYLPYFGYTIQDWVAKTIIAIGQATAKYMHLHGIYPQLVAKEEVAEGILVEIKTQPLQTLQNAYFFWPHSALSRPIISHFFKEQGFFFEQCILYEPQFIVPESLLSLEKFDEIVFTSPSTVNAFLAIFGYLPKDKILTPIGPITANYLKTKLS